METIKIYILVSVKDGETSPLGAYTDKEQAIQALVEVAKGTNATLYECELSKPIFSIGPEDVSAHVVGV
jgi:hypothetical protein